MAHQASAHEFHKIGSRFRPRRTAAHIQWAWRSQFAAVFTEHGSLLFLALSYHYCADDADAYSEKRDNCWNDEHLPIHSAFW